jgi:hypothetical protein
VSDGCHSNCDRWNSNTSSSVVGTLNGVVHSVYADFSVNSENRFNFVPITEMTGKTTKRNTKNEGRDVCA